MPYRDAAVLAEGRAGCCARSHVASDAADATCATATVASRGAAGDFCPPATAPSFAPHRVIEPAHIDIALTPDIPRRTLAVALRHTLRNPHTTNGSLPRALLSRIVLNLVAADALAVASATDGQPLSYTYDGRAIVIVWDRPFNPLEERAVTISYTITRPIGGAYFSQPDLEYPSTPYYVVSDHEPELARHWLATVDFPTVRTTLDFTITHDAKHVALANGTFISSKDNPNGTKSTRYKLDFRCPSYLVCFAIGEFIEVDDGYVDEMPIKYFAPKGTDPADVRRAFDKTPTMVKWLSKKLNVKFPWTKYYQFVAQHIRGAMENISLVSWSPMFVMDETWASERKMVTDTVNIHEMAHTYFGDSVVIKHFEHVWLKESWATYIESVWIQDHFTEDDFRYEMLHNADDYIAETSRYNRPIVTRRWPSSWGMFDSHTYPGGCWRLHMLRSIMGDTCFWTAVSKYLITYKEQTAETENFRNILEKESGLNLQRFFDQWIYAPGFPKLKASFEYVKDKKLVMLTVEQTQVDKSQGIGLFDFTLDVEVTDTAGKTYMGAVEFSGAVEAKRFVAVPVGDAKPVMLRFDPAFKLLFSLDCNPGEDVLVYTAKNAKDVPNRIWAYRELAKIGSPQVLGKLKDAILNEPFYGVRTKVADAVAKVKTRAAAEVLAAMAINEKDPRAQWGVARNLKLRDASTRETLLQFLKRKDLTYRGRAAALECLGLQTNSADLPLLLASAKDDKLIGQHGLTRAGALRALGNHRSGEAFSYLLSRVARGLEPERIRPVVFEALATSAPWQEPRHVRQVVDILVDGLREEDFGVRRACIWGLVDLEAREHVGDILAVKKEIPEQDHFFVDRRLRALLADGGASLAGPGHGSEKIKALATTVEELEGKIRKLEDKIAELVAKDAKPQDAADKKGDGRDKEKVSADLKEDAQE